MREYEGGAPRAAAELGAEADTRRWWQTLTDAERARLSR